MACESRWSLLVFWIPHIHWRRLSNKVEEISENLTSSNEQKHAQVQDCRQQQMTIDNEPVQSTGGRPHSQQRLRTCESVDASKTYRQLTS